MTYDLIIIGAGAAGLFAAANVPVGMKTLVLEKTEKPGQKLLLTGSGQCNLTNDEPIKLFTRRYGANGKRIRPVLYRFSNMALMEFFVHNAVELTVREDGKVFPKSMKSADVLRLLLDLCKARNVEFRCAAEVTDIAALDESGVFGAFAEDGHEACEASAKSAGNACGFSVRTAETQFLAKCILVATGGVSYPQTGSDGTFFSCLERLGLTLVPRRPALTSIVVSYYPYSELSGLSFTRSRVEISRGESGFSAKLDDGLLLTHKGFSGPAVLNISRYVMPGDIMTVNYLQGETGADLYAALMTAAAGDARQIDTLLSAVTALPRSFTQCVCRRVNIEPGEKASRLSGKEMDKLAKAITADSFEVTGTGGFSTAMTTAGGVSLDEVNLRTMESTRYPGLYFSGEVLDIDGDTGGYNLQFAFCSAFCSIQDIISKIN